MPMTTTNRLSKFRARTKKRRTSVMTRAKYKPRTTTANRSLIKSNAYAIRALKRLVPPVVRTDYQLGGVLYSDTQSTDFSTNYQFAPLMNPLTWEECLRIDQNTLDSSTTRVLRMSMNLRYSLFSSNWAQITMFVVTIRPDSAQRDLSNLVIRQDYINSVGGNFNTRLSPQLVKVHATRNVTLTKNSWISRSVEVDNRDFAGNPATTFKKGQVNIKMGIKIRNPNRASPWKDMEINQFSPHERYYLLCFFTQQSDVAQAGSGARVDYDCLFTCMNSS